jgi:hypothetical protein
MNASIAVGHEGADPPLRRKAPIAVAHERGAQFLAGDHYPGTSRPIRVDEARLDEQVLRRKAA